MRPIFKSIIVPLTMASTPAVAATILSGNDPGTGITFANNVDLPVNYGSLLSGTPNISLNWTATNGGKWQEYTNWPNAGTGGLAFQVDGYNATRVFNIAFTPANVETAVKLTSVACNVWSGGGDTALTWSVTGSISGILASGPFTAPNAAVTPLNFNTLNPLDGVVGLGGETLTFTFTATTGKPSYFALDNISFDQVAAVPEPSAAVIAAAGLGAMAMRRRRSM